MLVAITGTIGSGKSTVTDILRKKGKNVISCDEINAKLLTESSYIEKIASEFPTCVKDGRIDKKILSDIVFTDENQRKKLNAIAHPAIFERVVNEAKLLKGDVFVEVPLLAESGQDKYFDSIWVITCDETRQLNRIVERDKIPLDKAKIIYNRQKEFEADFSKPVIYIENNADYNELKAKIEKIL